VTTVELRPGESQASLLRRFRKKVQRSRVLSEARRKRYFVSNSEKRRYARRKAIRRERKRLAKLRRHRRR
jgi:ribosomal protein S21